MCTAPPCGSLFNATTLSTVRFSTPSHSSPPTLIGVEIFLVSCNPRWPSTTSSANSSQSSILHTDMPNGSQVQQTQIGPCRSATLDLYAKADSTVFSAPCFQQAIHPRSSACQNTINPSSPPCRIMSPQFLLALITTVLPESRLRMTQAIIPGDRILRSELFITNTVLAQTTFRRSCFRMKLLERPQYYRYQSRPGVKTLLYEMFLGGGW